MSNYPTDPTSMTGSSSSWVSDGGSGGSSPRVSRAMTGSSGSWVSDGGPGGSSPRAGAEIVTCGALAGHIRDIAARRGWRVSVRSLPAALHNRPEKIPHFAERALLTAGGQAPRTILAYADCGTYGTLDELAERTGARRLPGLHCYDLFAGPERIRAMFHVEPGTYLLTDYLVRTFDHTVLASLGLDRYPELWPDYFGHYTRVVWLAQEPTPALEAEAARIAERFGLPLTRVDTGLDRLESALAALIEESE